jgi:hypothetical protein
MSSRTGLLQLRTSLKLVRAVGQFNCNKSVEELAEGGQSRSLICRDLAPRTYGRHSGSWALDTALRNVSSPRSGLRANLPQ